MGRAQDEIERLKAGRAAALQAQRAARATANLDPGTTKPGAPTVGTPISSTDLKTAVTPGGTIPSTTTAPVVTGTPGWELTPGQGSTPSIIVDAAAANAALLPPGSEKPIEALPPPPSSPPNRLAKEGIFQQNLDAAAQNYRNLPANAPADQRAAAKQEYTNALNDKAAGLRVDRAGREYTRTLGLREDRMAQQAQQALGPQATPDEQNQAMANAREYYRSLTPEQQGTEYYNRSFLPTKGIDPNSIGGARLYTMAGGTRGLIVPSPEQSIAARNDVNEAAKRAREMLNEERALRQSKDPKDRVLANQVREKRVQFENESRLTDPFHPTAGMNTDTAFQKALANRLSGDQSTLSGRAKEREEVKKTEQKIKESTAEKAEKPVDKTQQELADMAERNRLERERWYENERRKQRAIYG